MVVIAVSISQRCKLRTTTRTAIVLLAQKSDKLLRTRMFIFPTTRPQIDRFLMTFAKRTRALQNDISLLVITRSCLLSKLLPSLFSVSRFLREQGFTVVDCVFSAACQQNLSVLYVPQTIFCIDLFEIFGAIPSGIGRFLRFLLRRQDSQTVSKSSSTDDTRIVRTVTTCALPAHLSTSRQVVVGKGNSRTRRANCYVQATQRVRSQYR